MANVWVVTSGEYSDYGIDAIFSTEEKAEAYLAQAKLVKLDSRIEPYELDVPVPEVWPRFCARIDLMSGEVTTGEVTYGYEPLNEKWGQVDHLLSCYFFQHRQPGHEETKTALYPFHDGKLEARSARSTEHAAKLAVEMRQEYLRRCSELGLEPFRRSQ